MKAAGNVDSGGGRPAVVMREKQPKRDVPAVVAWGESTRLKVLGWLGVVLMAAALSDYALALYPLGFGSPEWEMATIGQIVQGLPLFTIGIAAIWLAAAGLGRRWMLMVVGWGALVVAALMLVGLLIFLTDVPLGLRSTHGVAKVGIAKLVAKTLFLGLVFGVSYIVAGVLALKQARGSRAEVMTQ